MKTSTRQRGGASGRSPDATGPVSLHQVSLQRLQQQQQRQQQQEQRDPYRETGRELPDKQQQTRHPRTENPQPGADLADQ